MPIRTSTVLSNGSLRRSFKKLDAAEKENQKSVFFRVGGFVTPDGIVLVLECALRRGLKRRTP